MNLTPWMPLSSLYRWTFSSDPSAVRVERNTGSNALLAKAGIYLIADPSLAGDWPGAKLIYIGSAGGRGAASTFHDRVHKHALKAMNATSETVAGSGVTDTVRWRQYRDERGLDSSPVSNWLVRLLVLPNGTDGERQAILFAEDALALAFDRRHHVGGRRVCLPRCNSQALGGRLLAVLDGVLDSPVAPQVHPEVQQPEAAPAAEAGAVELLLPVQAANMDPHQAVPDDAVYDEEYEGLLGPERAAVYPLLLAALQGLCESPEGRTVGLRVYYTNKNGRELRLGWARTRPFEVLLCIGRVGDAFDAYTRAPAEVLPSSLDVFESEGGRFRRYRAAPQAFVAHIGSLAGAILQWATALPSA